MLLDLSKLLRKVIGFTDLLTPRENPRWFLLCESNPVALESHSNCDRTSQRTKSVRVSRMRRTTGQGERHGSARKHLEVLAGLGAKQGRAGPRRSQDA
jgi:hypothetical protein